MSHGEALMEATAQPILKARRSRTVSTGASGAIGATESGVTGGAGAAGGVAVVNGREQLVQRVRNHAFRDDAEFRRYGGAAAETGALATGAELSDSRTVDYLFATPEDPHEPEWVFERLRWGGQFIFASRYGREVNSLASQYAAKGFAIERGPERVHRWLLGVPLISLDPRAYFFVARKVRLIPPGEYNNRFTYDVHLERNDGQYVVAKQIPDVATIVERLRLRQPQAAAGDLERQARDLVETVFPVFLTREAAFLQILQSELPEVYRRRVPKAVALEKNERGMVTKLRLNWLRKTDKPMSHIDFAVQSADLLYRLHHVARIIHLDLRLDNFVITDEGVGFVDFGSAARAGENIAASPLLHKLFNQLMRTSQVQRVLEKMTADGLVTSRFLTCARHKVDRAVDLFYLTAQLERPDANPYTRELVNYCAGSHEAKLISNLAAEVLRPSDPLRPTYTSARDLLHGLTEIKQRLS